MMILMVMISCTEEKDDYLVTIKTNMGEIKLVLFDETPLHKENFIKLAKEGKFDSTIFHRVIDGFMIQGGDINAKKGEKGTINYTIPAEIQEEVTGKFLHTRGAVAAARMGDQMNPQKASSGSQFYIVDGTVYERYLLDADWNKLTKGMRMLLQDTKFAYLLDSVNVLRENGGTNEDFNKFFYRNRHLVEENLNMDVSTNFSDEQIEAYTTIGGAYGLDNEYTVFGRVVEGMDVVDKIAAVATVRDRPKTNIGMLVELEPMNKSEITEKYGITFPESTQTETEE